MAKKITDSLNINQKVKSAKGGSGFIVPEIIPQKPSAALKIDVENIPMPTNEAIGNYGAIEPPMNGALDAKPVEYKPKTYSPKFTKKPVEQPRNDKIEALQLKSYLDAEKEAEDIKAKLRSAIKLNESWLRGGEGSLANQVPLTDPNAKIPEPPKPMSDMERVGDVAQAAYEVPAAFLSGAASSVKAIPSGISELSAVIKEGKFGTKEGADRIEQAYAKSLADTTYSPRSEAGQQALRFAAEAIPVDPVSMGMMAAAGSGLRAARAATSTEQAGMTGARSTAQDAAAYGRQFVRDEVVGAPAYDVAARAAGAASDAVASGVSMAAGAVSEAGQAVGQRVRQAVTRAPAQTADEILASRANARQSVAQQADNAAPQAAAMAAEDIRPQQAPQQPPSPPAPPAPPSSPIPPSTPSGMAGLSARELAREAKMATAPIRPRQESLATVVEHAEQSPEVLAAARSLGINDLDPAFATKNEAFRAVDASLKQTPQSRIAAKEKVHLEEISAKTKDVLQRLSETDVANVNQDVFDAAVKVEKEWRDSAKKRYDKISAAHGGKVQGRADGLIAAIEEDAKRLNTIENLPNGERRVINDGMSKISSETRSLYNAMKPKEVKVKIADEVSDPITGQTTPAKYETSMQYPNLNSLDEARKELTKFRLGADQASNYTQGFSSHLKKKYEKILMEDYKNSLRMAGLDDAANEVAKAQLETAIAKRMQKKIDKNFGIDQSKSIVSNITRATAESSKGNITPMVELLKAAPDKKSRQGIIMSGIFDILTKKGKADGNVAFIEFTKHMRGLQAHPKAFNYVMSQLEPKQRQALMNITKVFDGIEKSFKARSSEMTGRGLRSEVQAEINSTNKFVDFAVDSVIGKIPSWGGIGGAVRTVADAGMSQIRGRAVERIEDMLMSQEFRRMVRSIGTPREGAAAEAFAASPSFVRATPRTSMEARFNSVNNALGGE